MAMIGLDCGPTRLPVKPLDQAATAALRDALATLGFFDWIAEPV
jgi:N-acetylneuraminate lyase